MCLVPETAEETFFTQNYNYLVCLLALWKKTSWNLVKSLFYSTWNFPSATWEEKGNCLKHLQENISVTIA